MNKIMPGFNGRFTGLSFLGKNSIPSLLSVFLSTPASAEPITVPPLLLELQSLAGSLQRPASAAALRAYFDRTAPPAATAVSPSGRLRELRDLLSHGTEVQGRPVMPFVFRLPSGGSLTAQSAGLEGFIHAEAELTAHFGKTASLRHLEDYFSYLDTLLAPTALMARERQALTEIREQKLAPERKYERLMSRLTAVTAALRAEVKAADRSAWIRKARIYEIFPRAFNLAGKRAAEGLPPGAGGKFFADFGAPDLAAIKAQGFDALWVMGIFPIGVRNAFGTAGGSPYSVKDHETVHPDLGTEAEFAGFVARAHAAGLKIVIDFIPNHTSMDSRLLWEHPDFFIQTPTGPRGPPRGSFDHLAADGLTRWISHGGYDSYGSLAFWEDTAQADYSNTDLRAEMIRIVRSWVSRFEVDAFRVDMAYQVTNHYFARNWRRPMPRREFLEELITEVRADAPATAFIAEAYDRWDDLSKAGFDLIYGKNNIDRPGGHQGWYDALNSRDPAWIREAIRRAAYLRWQAGGSDALDFVGNHDEAAPERAFGPWRPGAAWLTLLMPGNLLFYGSQEIGFDRPVPAEPKSIPFSVPVQVDWASGDPQTLRFYREAFAQAGALRAEGEWEIRPLDGAAEGWAGYLLVSAGGAKVAVLANPSDRPVQVTAYSTSLPAFGYSLLRIP